MSSYAFKGTAQIIANGGPVTKTTFKPVSGSDWGMGQLLYLSTSGELAPLVAVSSAAEIDTDDTTAAGSPLRLFVAINPYGDLATAETGVPSDGYVAVQEVFEDTVFEVPVCETGGGNGIAALADINGTFAGYQLTTGAWAVDIGNTTKPVFRVQEVSPNYNPWDPASALIYNKVRVTVIPSLIQK